MCNINSGCEALVRTVVSLLGLVLNVATLQEQKDNFKLVTTKGQNLEML